MRVPGVNERPNPVPLEAWGAGFVHALRQAQALTPAPAARSVALNSQAPPRPADPFNPPAARAAPQPRQASLWDRLVGLVQEAVRAALGLLRTGLDHLLRTLGGR